MSIKQAETFGYQVSYTHRGRKLHSKTSSLCLLALVSGNASNDTNLQNSSQLTHETLKGISDVVTQFKARLIIDFVNSAELPTADLKAKCKPFDGIIFIHSFKEVQVKSIAQAKPCVSADYVYPQVKMDVVSGGDVDNFVFLIEYLQKLGHARIGYLDFPGGLHPRGIRGYLGFLGGLIQTGLAATPAFHLLNSDFPNEKSKITRAIELTKKKKRDCWVCANDFAAMELYRQCATAGISVPEDISITGFGGIDFPGIPLELCSFRTPFEQIGQEAAKYLFDRIRFPGTPARHAFVNCVFIEGNSVKCLK